MRFKTLLFVLLASTTIVLAHDDEKPLCPDYGAGRIGSMYPDGFGVIVYGDFLYWTAQMDGLDLALEQTPFFNNTNDASVVGLDFNWDPAFRVGLGYYFKCRDWDLSLDWTRFRTSASNIAVAGGSTLFPFWGRVGTSSTRVLERISGHWDLHYDTLDLLFHPGYFRYQHFAIQPEFGVRGAWIDWDYTIDQSFFDSQDSSTLTQHLPYENHYHGAGFLAAVNTKWFIGWGLQMYANALTSVIYGEFELDQPSTVTLQNQSSPFKTASSQDYWRVRSNMHLAMGLAWEKLFANNAVRLNIYLGYEFLTWFNQNQLYRARTEIFGSNDTLEFTPYIERDDLGINGLSAGMRLEF